MLLVGGAGHPGGNTAGHWTDAEALGGESGGHTGGWGAAGGESGGLGGGRAGLDGCGGLELLYLALLLLYGAVGIVGHEEQCQHEPGYD